MQKLGPDLFEKLAQDAKASPRRRVSLRLHKEDGDLVQRMVNCLDAVSYVQPHKHENPDKNETFVILKGRLLALEFDDRGEVTGHVVLDAKGQTRGVHIPARTWHTFISLEEGTCVFECKDGPYDAKTDKVLASWAPAEGDKEAAGYMHDIFRKVQPNLKANISFSSVVKTRMGEYHNF